MSLSKDFQNPDKEYRGKPFWAWNGKLEKEEAVRQVKIFKEMGLGGAFMHARVGLETPYLSSEWFDVVNACVEEGRKSGLEMWLYDEDRWPSGAAGGLVTREPQYRSKRLKIKVSDPDNFKGQGDEIALFSAQIKENQAENVKKITPDETAGCSGQAKILSFRRELDEPSSWFNGYTYLDTMSEEAVKKFIEVTHDAYLKNCGKDFSKIIPGIFTDEPHYGYNTFDGKEGFTQWTDILPSVFREKYGYDLIDRLPELFFTVDSKEFSKVRRDYRDCLTRLFTQNFGRLIYEWCEKNNLLFTGHVLAESTLRSQTGVVGAAMRFYEYMQAPGIDILSAEGLSRPGGKDREILTTKQCASVCRQFGRKWLLSELYGCTGWHFNFAEHKAVGDWQAALGVNLRCQHLSWYTMKGEAKRDYPASISFQSSWYRDYPVVEDYFSRVNLMLTQGEVIRDLAVIHPIESAWGIHRPGVENPLLTGLDASVVELQNMLLEEHYDFDYIDEEIFEKHGKVERNSLKVALAGYKAVIVPPIFSIRKSTHDILCAFLRAGGKVILIENPEELADINKCEYLESLKKTAARCTFQRKAITKILGGIKEIRKVSILDSGGKEYGPVYYMMRNDEAAGRTIVFICHNIQNKSSGKITVSIPASGVLQEWDPQTGNIFRLECRGKNILTVFDTELPAYGSRLFVVEKGPAGGRAVQKCGKLKTISRTKINPPTWLLERDEPNIFPLDRAFYSLDGSNWIGPVEILMLDRVVRDICGLPYRGGRMVQPWARTNPPDFNPRAVQIAFSFMAEKIPENGISLIMESPDKFKALLNGNELPLKDRGWWIDNSLRKINLPAGSLVKGYNKLILKTGYGPDSAFESVYLAGDFGFRRDGLMPVITDEPKNIKIGDWSEFGLTCYSGALSYITALKLPSREKNEKVFIEIPDWKGVLIKVYVDNRPAGNMAWPPHELDITEFVSGRKKCSLKIVLAGSRRNLFGPHHLNNPCPVWTGPAQFVPSLQDWTDSYVTLPCGIMEAPKLSIRR